MVSAHAQERVSLSLTLSLTSRSSVAMSKASATWRLPMALMRIMLRLAARWQERLLKDAIFLESEVTQVRSRLDLIAWAKITFRQYVFSMFFARKVIFCYTIKLLVGIFL